MADFEFFGEAFEDGGEDGAFALEVGVFGVVDVETTALTGETVTTVYERGLARLIHHEIDHLNGLLYTTRMRSGVDPIPAEEYRQTGQTWSYEIT